MTREANERDTDDGTPDTEAEDRRIDADGTPRDGKPGGRIVIADSRRPAK